MQAPHEAAQKYIDAATVFKKVAGGAGNEGDTLCFPLPWFILFKNNTFVSCWLALREDFVRCTELAVARYLDMGRFAIAAKHVMSLAEMYETQIVDLEKAIKYYEQVLLFSFQASCERNLLFQAADHFDGEDSTSGKNKALLKVDKMCWSLIEGCVFVCATGALRSSHFHL